MNFVVEVVEIETGEVVRSIPCATEQRASW